MSRRDWIATYRLQLHRGFTLAAAAEVLPYLARLGISHVYLSPCLQATPGSEHGYDVVDPSRISDDLGGEVAWRAFVQAARDSGLGVLLDIVPNHMAASWDNLWWRDLLQHGPYSAYAETFDVSPCDGGERWRLHLCTLDRAYGNVLRDGGFLIDLGGKEPALACGGLRGPLNPLSWPLFLEPAAEVAPGAAVPRPSPDLRDLLSPDVASRIQYARAADESRSWWQAIRREPRMLGAVQAGCEAMARDPARMHELIERQYYRPCWWRLEGEAVNYRRFFNIGGLVGVRMENPAVFAATHARVARMVEDGDIDGLRVDHPDGLRDPAGYLKELRSLVSTARIYVEKILDADEMLPRSWPVEGTVGYDFLSKVNRLWMHGEKADRLTAIYAEYTRHSVNFPGLVRDKKLATIDSAFTGDCRRLVGAAVELARAEWRWRDLSARQIETAIRALTALLAVYRPSRPPAPGAARARDLAVLAAAIAEARAFATDVFPDTWDFLHEVLAREEPDPIAGDFIARWQQLTPAVMAKGAEDTTFYVYDRLVSGNEVGSQPSALGIPAEQFHAYCHRLSADWPRNLLATSTHDNKRSEDVRLRISLLTEIPERWSEAVQSWTRLNQPAWGGRQPDRHAEYLLYQTLVGAWPISIERVQAYMLKACREAKVHTSWIEPDADYEAAVTGFAARILGDTSFVESIEAFIAPLLRPAGIHSLAQTLIKLTAPGVPDFYQGTELWELSLVDPDNRRPVDFALRATLLERSAKADVTDVLAAWESGWPKLWMIWRVLRFRRDNEAIFAEARSYEPVMARGAKLAHVFAYRRGGDVIVIVPRFILSLDGGWEDTSVVLPAGAWRNEFSGAIHAGDTRVAELFSAFPVTLLRRIDEGEGS